MTNDIKISKNFNIKEGRIRDHSKLDILCSSCLQSMEEPHLDTCIGNISDKHIMDTYIEFINSMCTYCILQTDTHFDPGFLCKLKPVKSRYGPFYERIDPDKCFLNCKDYVGRNQPLESHLTQNASV